MKGTLVQVGFDTNNGGYSAPLFENGEFIYLPIHERRKTQGSISYEDLPLQNGRNPSHYLPNGQLILDKEKLSQKDSITRLPLDLVEPHYDPEFESFTYGEQSVYPKGRRLLTMESGDVLFFFESFIDSTISDYRTMSLNDIKRCQLRMEKKYAIIGYFEIECILTHQDIINDPTNEQRVQRNSHLRRSPLEDTILIVTGTKRSKLLKRIKPLSVPAQRENGTPYYVFSPEFSSVSGLKQIQVYRGHRNVEDGSRVRRIIQWLDS